MQDFKEFLDQYKSKHALYETLIRLNLAKPIVKTSNLGMRKVGRRSKRKVARK